MGRPISFLDPVGRKGKTRYVLGQGRDVLQDIPSLLSFKARDLTPHTHPPPPATPAPQDHTLDTVKDHVDAKLDHFKTKATKEGLELHAKLEGELEDAVAKAIVERREKVEKLQRTPGVLRGVRGNFLDFEGKDPQAAAPTGQLEPQLDQVRFMKDHILVLDTTEKQVAFGPAAEIRAAYPNLQIVDEYDSSKIIVPGFIDTHTYVFSFFERCFLFCGVFLEGPIFFMRSLPRVCRWCPLPKPPARCAEPPFLSFTRSPLLVLL
jgi:hypothetical protein